ncbi:MAG: hypothetical protein M5U12_15715 [Verrucomicrobia bacterium]|nr:hypothetical protein [Verrucomicrobiota bacterium]
MILFVFDVAIRRLYLDRAEWLKATEPLRRRLFFWRQPVRPAETKESLAALLSRRGQVRAEKTGAGQPRPELFEPAQPVAATPPVAAPTTAKASEAKPAAPAAPTPAPERGAHTSRLLEAKRRASRKLDQS